MKGSTYRIIGIWEENEYEQVYQILRDVPFENYMWSSLVYRREDGQSGRSILVNDLDLAKRIEQIGVAHIYYEVRVGAMSLDEHREIAKLLYKQRIPIYCSISYKLDKSIDFANWGIADAAAAMMVKLKWGKQ